MSYTTKWLTKCPDFLMHMQISKLCGICMQLDAPAVVEPYMQKWNVNILCV